VQDNQPVELPVKRGCRALIEPLTDNAMDEAIDADPRGDIVGAAQEGSWIHPFSASKISVTNAARFFLWRIARAVSFSACSRLRKTVKLSLTFLPEAPVGWWAIAFRARSSGGDQPYGVGRRRWALPLAHFAG
jgi:hypothetical protein